VPERLQLPVAKDSRVADATSIPAKLLSSSAVRKTPRTTPFETSSMTTIDPYWFRQVPFQSTIAPLHQSPFPRTLTNAAVSRPRREMTGGDLTLAA
jgi:hypothetical protein